MTQRAVGFKRFGGAAFCGWNHQGPRGGWFVRIGDEAPLNRLIFCSTFF
jgi:hypothetical protein